MPTPHLHRRNVLAGNWKMHFSPGEAVAYFSDLGDRLAHRAPVPSERRVIFPVAYCLTPPVAKAAARPHIELGGQNIHWEEKGAFTGELSGIGLRDLGVRWCLIAHSERRQYFAETDETAAKRLSRALTLGFNIIYCIGERLEEREAGQTELVLARQLKPFAHALTTWAQNNGDNAALLNSIDDPTAPTLSIAYEPVWAIGTGKTATTEQAEQAHRFIRKELDTLLEKGPLKGAADSLPLLYGGSVTAENCSALMAQPNVDGVLVGGASLKPEVFATILASPHKAS
jgi:triosephosphate isomerase